MGITNGCVLKNIKPFFYVISDASWKPGRDLGGVNLLGIDASAILVSSGGRLGRRWLVVTGIASGTLIRLTCYSGISFPAGFLGKSAFPGFAFPVAANGAVVREFGFI